MTGLTETLITRQLMADRYRKTFCLPNYTPDHWWECDMFEITRAGYFREYEVKLSLADFKRDPVKARQQGRWEKGAPRPMVTKHSRLAQADEQGPAEFYYVAPTGVIPHIALPPWAGLFEVEHRPDGPARFRVMIHLVRFAPRLHKAKATPSVRKHAVGVCYWRYQHLLHK